jgi:hypothetical protein
VVGRIRSTEISNDLIGNRTRDLLACSIVPQPTTLTGCNYEELCLLGCDIVNTDMSLLPSRGRYFLRNVDNDVQGYLHNATSQDILI